jgi:putative AlgH/UPF0301 family transcriptional regulator
MTILEEMIEKLIDDDIATIKLAMYQNDYEYLFNILRDGMGYSNWLPTQIVKEFNSRTWEAIQV